SIHPSRASTTEDQPRELLSDHPQLVFRADFVELVRSKSCSPVLACTKRAVVEPRRLVIIRPSLPKLDNVASGAGFPYLSRKPVPFVNNRGIHGAAGASDLVLRNVHTGNSRSTTSPTIKSRKPHSSVRSDWIGN